jgi:hypothetical protein
VDIAEYLCGELVEQVQRHISRPWPECPWHLGRHPLEFTLNPNLDARWVCPENRQWIPVGKQA